MTYHTTSIVKIKPLLVQTIDDLELIGFYTAINYNKHHVISLPHNQ